MSGFKAMVEADNKTVFLNKNEFAEPRTIFYDGVSYNNVPVLLTKVKEADRPIQTLSDHAQGLYRISAVLHISLEDMAGVVPEKGRTLKISDGEAAGAPFFYEYTVATSSCELGMLRIELESIDE